MAKKKKDGLYDKKPTVKRRLGNYKNTETIIKQEGDGRPKQEDWND